MNILALPAFADNYLWLLHDGRQALVVDPGDAQPVLAALQQLRLQLTSILVTHHHPDHTGGIAALRAATAAVVYGPAGETIPQPHVAVRAGHRCQALGLDWQVLDVPGHTAGHVAYYHPAVPGVGPQHSSAPVLFCGDTLFSAGCGRLFEGTATQMLASLDKLAALPDATLVCCAHEYTLSNLQFALAVEPDNPALQAYARHCHQLRAQQRPTLPSTLALERQINPFLRSRQPSVKRAVQTWQTTADDDVAVFTALRLWKNTY
jgi:hydroxyacylglutathione hydrolase